MVPKLTLRHIYIYPVGIRGGPDFHIFSAAREPRNFWKNASYRRKKQMKSCEGAPGKTAAREPKNRVRTGGLPRSHLKVRAPSQLMKRFSPQNGRYGGHFRNIFESLPRKVRAPSGLLRSSSRSAERSKFRQNRLFRASVPQKERDSKMCQKSGPNHTPHSAERTIFPRSNSQKSSVPQKERFFGKFIKTETETPKVRHMEKTRKPWKN